MGINIIKKYKAEIGIVDHELLLIVGKEKYLLTMDSIEEVAVFKNDHMTFDTLILRLRTSDKEYELPFEITFSVYQKINDRYVIPKFKIKPLIAGFDKLIVWLHDNLKNMKLDWLDEKQIIDENNIVINYTKNSMRRI